MTKVVALLAFRDEESYLSGFFAHLRNYVDEFIVLDDDSQDRSLEIAQSQANTHVLMRETSGSFPDHYFEVDNHRLLLETALARNAEWVLCCDADERHEKRFLDQVQTIVSGSKEVFALRVRDLWDSCSQYRVDGFWAHKAKFVLFPLVPFVDYYPSYALHTKWVPPNIPCRDENVLDFNLYHLLSIRREDRLKRLTKFRTVDPENKYQPKIGYEYLGDETGLKLDKVAAGREFEVLLEDAHLCQ
jgi:glycosyltransferase involved in cell wall biosynthesis